MSVFGMYIIGAYFFKGKVPEALEWKKERNLFFRPYKDGQFLYYSPISSRPYIVPNDEVRLQIEQKHKLNQKCLFLMIFILIFFWVVLDATGSNERSGVLIVTLIVSVIVMSGISRFIMRPVLKQLIRVDRKPPYFERLQEVSDHYSYGHLITQFLIISMICVSPLISITQGETSYFKVILFVCILPAVISYMIMIIVKSRSIFRR